MLPLSCSHRPGVCITRHNCKARSDGGEGRGKGPSWLVANEAFSLKSASVRWAGWATVTYGRVGKLKTRVGKRKIFKHVWSIVSGVDLTTFCLYLHRLYYDVAKLAICLWEYMLINCNKFCCMRIGSRCDKIVQTLIHVTAVRWHGVKINVS